MLLEAWLQAMLYKLAREYGEQYYVREYINFRCVSTQVFELDRTHQDEWHRSRQC